MGEVDERPHTSHSPLLRGEGLGVRFRGPGDARSPRAIIIRRGENIYARGASARGIVMSNRTNTIGCDGNGL